MSDVMPLNPAQRAGVEHRGGPLLLLAGAGTGKTRVITHRVAALIDEGVPAWRILAVTFTNKAAQEMRQRIAGLLGLELDELRRDGPWIGTFHSICARILRRHGQSVGLSRNFAIYDADDQRALMRRVLKAIDVDPRMFSERAALGKIDSAKNLGLPRTRLHELGLGEPVFTWTRRAWALYEDQLRAADAADFGDLLTLAVDLLRQARLPGEHALPASQPEPGGAPRRKLKLHTASSSAGGEMGAPASVPIDPIVGLRRRFFHVVVDEYQDTNRVQAELVDLLCGPRSQLCVVGDDDQAIYGWRGADVKQILGFPDRHRGCEVIRLEQNYRSTSLILDCANAIIKSGVRRHDKELWSELGAGEPVALYGFEDEREEARQVAGTIARAIEEGESPAEIVVFYRTHAQSRPLEEAMRRWGVRYRMLGGIRFFDRREVKDLVSYLRLMTNQAGDLDCLRIINVPARRIGAKSIERLSTYAARAQISIFAACGPEHEHGTKAGLGKAAARAVKSFWELVTELAELGPKLEHHQAAALVLQRSKYIESLEEEPDGDTRIENLSEFIGSLEQFVNEQPDASLAEYLEQISLATDAEAPEIDQAITMMTIHSAKGLEFDRVWVTGMEEGVFPHMRVLQGDDPNAIEEERRLAYVALTRARRKLTLSYVESRFLWGKSQHNEPSRFLRQLPEHAIARYGRATAKRRKPKPRLSPKKRTPKWDDDIELEPEYAGSTPIAKQAGGTEVEVEVEYESEEPGVSVFKGMQVHHQKFGVGTVLAWSGNGANMKLTISFGVGRKTIMARFCKVL